MPEFLLELYLSRDASVDTSVRSAQLAAEKMTREGRPVRCVRSIFVPDDETCFLLYEAALAEDVEEAARQASLSFDRAALPIAAEERRL